MSGHVESLSICTWEVTRPSPSTLNMRILKQEKLRNLPKMMQVVSNKAWMEICFADYQFSVPLTLPHCVTFAKTKPIQGSSWALWPTAPTLRVNVLIGTAELKSVGGKVWTGGESTSKRAFWPAPGPQQV